MGRIPQSSHTCKAEIGDGLQDVRRRPNRLTRETAPGGLRASENGAQSAPVGTVGTESAPAAMSPS
jgi:hypothetical protein